MRYFKLKSLNILTFYFPAKTNAWKQRKLGEVVRVNPGRDYKHLSTGDIPVYGTGGYMLSVDESLSDADAIGIGRKGTIDKPQLLSAPFWTVDTLFYMTPCQGNDLLYLYSLSQNTEWAKMDESTGVPSLSKVNIEKVNVYVPHLFEQATIGNFFRTLDDIITLHKRKLDGLKKLKKGYLQQMFPQKDETVPRLRFAGFTGNWERRNLGELFSERSERSAEGELISVTINSGVIKSNTLDRKDNSSADKSNYKKVQVGDIAYNSMRMWQGASGVSNYSGILSPAYTVITPNHGVSSLFFSYMFKLTKMIQTFQTNSQGLTSDTWNLKYPLLKNISIAIPCFEEQKQTGDFFRKFDEKITVQQDKLDKLKQLKSAYLQKMFI